MLDVHSIVKIGWIENHRILQLTHPSWTDRTEEDELMQRSLGNVVDQ